MWKHRAAASRTPGLDGRDAELSDIMAELVSLPSVAEIADAGRTVDALHRLGIIGRGEFVGPNTQVLTHMREDGDLLHVYAYHFLYETGETTEVNIRVPGKGAVNVLDPWTGRIRAHSGVSYEEAPITSTVIHTRLAPGEIALFTVDRSLEGSASEANVLETVADLTNWTIAVESWDAGPNEVIEEDRGLGYVSREIRPTTAITRISSPSRTLTPWKDLEGVGPEVSGIGEYRTSVFLDVVPKGRILLDLGSTCGGLGSVSVNGEGPRGFVTSRPIVDISDLIRPGENEIMVRTASSLNNRLLARGYYETVPDLIALFSLGIEQNQTTYVRDHGLVGPVRLLVEKQ
ncbi:hypothetical protein [Schaalia hyovaginalis]|uniref:hypothetical protein n=1 Tax=Schaalia hyovaginalis TaxID=29316 RepID=UPI002A75F552|nr:hypothetical protein [Schaalia hyovaginalis]MDY2669190.1 hypothetical protein [Schaalia hyovaginalis]